ncbi:antitoxin VbhA family protein [Propionicicella superfundia]|uniref:antitoxin VbhA family protein n=1 Tax=Propionicicella superfundia TaxID=348582 RepID=UPI00040A9FE0|nr:antitoxin VbhA family protein [Propionicicella superfundia]
MAHAIARPARADVDDRLAFADAALGLAGHEVTDPALRALMERVASNEMTADEAVAAMRQHVQD